MSVFRRIGTRRLATTGFLKLEREYVADPEGAWWTREAVRHPGSAVVAPWDGERVVLIRQHRQVVGRSLLELPAGKLDVPGEAPEETARRECVEEAGLLPGRLTLLQICFTSPGFTDERSWIYLAEDLAVVPADPQGAEERAATLVRLDQDQVAEGLRAREFEDATTIIGLYALLDHLTR